MENKEENILNSKELQFCINYVNTGNVEKSALKSGYKKNSLKIGSYLLEKESVLKKINDLYQKKRKNFLYRAFCGYEKLAFGSINDAVSLLFSKNLKPDEIENLDLFNVSEIKIRDGSLEIKFFDRLRALEKLQQIDFADNSKTSFFYDAIEKGTEVFNEN